MLTCLLVSSLLSAASVAWWAIGPDLVSGAHPGKPGRLGPG